MDSLPYLENELQDVWSHGFPINSQRKSTAILQGVLTPISEISRPLQPAEKISAHASNHKFRKEDNSERWFASAIRCTDGRDRQPYITRFDSQTKKGCESLLHAEQTNWSSGVNSALSSTVDAGIAQFMYSQRNMEVNETKKSRRPSHPWLSKRRVKLSSFSTHHLSTLFPPTGNPCSYSFLYHVRPDLMTTLSNRESRNLALGAEGKKRRHKQITKRPSHPPTSNKHSKLSTPKNFPYPWPLSSYGELSPMKLQTSQTDKNGN